MRFSAGLGCDRPTFHIARRAPRSIVKIGGKIGFQNVPMSRSNRTRGRGLDREIDRRPIAVESG